MKRSSKYSLDDSSFMGMEKMSLMLAQPEVVVLPQARDHEVLNILHTYPHYLARARDSARQPPS